LQTAHTHRSRWPFVLFRFRSVGNVFHRRVRFRKKNDVLWRPAIPLLEPGSQKARSGAASEHVRRFENAKMAKLVKLIGILVQTKVYLALEN